MIAKVMHERGAFEKKGEKGPAKTNAGGRERGDTRPAERLGVKGRDWGVARGEGREDRASLGITVSEKIRAPEEEIAKRRDGRGICAWTPKRRVVKRSKGDLANEGWAIWKKGLSTTPTEGKGNLSQK